MELFDFIIVGVAIILLHLWVASYWLRFFRQDENAKNDHPEIEKDGEIVKANAVPMVNNT